MTLAENKCCLRNAARQYILIKDLMMFLLLFRVMYTMRPDITQESALCKQIGYILISCWP